MIASLPMYERPETRGAHDRLWAAVVEDLKESRVQAPSALTRGADPWTIWEDPALLVAQTCGLPYRAQLHDRVTLVGTPDYGLSNAGPGQYFSVIVARAGWSATEAPIPAVNDALSQSGWAALFEWSRAVGLQLGNPVHSGAHEASARMVATGQADIAAIDAVTWQILDRYLPSLTRELSVIGDTPATPGLPLITARAELAGRIFSAFAGAIAALAPADRTATGLEGIHRIPSSAYLSMPMPPAPTAT